MNFKFQEDEQKVIDIIHDFGVKEVAPLAAELDKEERFPAESRQKLANMGMMGICYPKEYGGAGHSYLNYIAVIEELAKHCATTSVMLSDHHSLGSWPIFKYGTEEQKKKFLTPLLKGEKLGAFAVTEPMAGSDVGNQQTTAVDKGDYWLLNGTKIFITNGFYADTYFVTAMTDKSHGHRGISAFIVEKGTPGFSFGTKEKKMGICGSATYELIFQDCKIPKENQLGESGKGFKIALATLDGGRIGVAAQALGIAQTAIDHSVNYVKEHTQSGERISQFQYAQWELADMQTKVDAARLLVYRAAQAKQDHEPFSHLAAMGKLYAAEAATNVTRRCLQLAGYDGCSCDFPFERFFRDAKITEIYEGTSEVQKMVISSWMGVK
ncbi:acyl-CoA dehydrogenase family protein (plasmid) [Clostridium estertheticum]|uniref:acyl-CoA dehydrogenase family protein n=1 Tax=Clostridium estertheticum TaxID=238834 RepID=UPI001C0D7062|nr:acyl-CoA dehydrogenase family protein [Clostridium estertheticum]MBU3217167.1 acyl-CoA dehydrogenase family protein [Clostridium estertheticum]WAG58120.1 acyl-CoA dehydrogenase family protein [Clostridium estertheticum]